MHGGAKGSGGPRGERNGNYKYGLWTREWWGTAGQRSLARSALVEGAEQLKRALAQIATLSATPALRGAGAICDRLIDGESLRAISADPRMPAKATVFRWLASNREFRRSYALARECQAEDFAYEILEIADDSSRDYVKKTGVDGKVTWVFDKEHVARQRLKIKALNWIMARIAPRKYGNS